MTRTYYHGDPRPFYVSRYADSPYDEYWCDDNGRPLYPEDVPDDDEDEAMDDEHFDADAALRRLRESLGREP